MKMTKVGAFKIEIPKTTLYNFYVERKYSLRKIAQLFKCAHYTIRKRLINYGIPTRSHYEAIRRGNTHPYYGKPLPESVKRKLSEMSKGRKLSDETKRKMSLIAKKRGMPEKVWRRGVEARIGKPLTQETKKKISKALRLYWQQKKFNIPKDELEKLYWKENLSIKDIAKKFGASKSTIRKLLKDYGIRRRNYKETLEILSKKTKERWQKPESEKIVRKIVQSLNKRPNNTERKVAKIIQKLGLPFKYTGNGSVVIGRRCPDFTYMSGKKVIEVFGEPWHQNSFKVIPYSKTEEGTIAHYSRWGFDCLVIWSKELKDETKVAKKISDFARIKGASYEPD